MPNKNSFFETTILENESVLLRKLDKNDLPNLLQFALYEPELWKYSLINGAGKEGLENYLQIAFDELNAQRELPFIVWDKGSKAYAGCTRYYDINIAYKTVQLGYTWYGKNFQGTMLNKNCKFLLFQNAFECHRHGKSRIKSRCKK